MNISNNTENKNAYQAETHINQEIPELLEYHGRKDGSRQHGFCASACGVPCIFFSGGLQKVRPGIQSYHCWKYSCGDFTTYLL